MFMLPPGVLWCAVLELIIAKRYITQESHKLEIQARPPIAVTNAVSWRSEGIRYRKNEVFLDVIESLNLLVNSNGNVLRSEILGAVKMKCYLSGMPELRLGLNDKVMFESTGRTSRGKAIEMEDVKFHQCVRLSRFENDRTISFIPPDGEFELMSYRLNTQVKPLIWVECMIESHSGSRIEYMLKAKAQFKRRSTANNVEIIVPVPEDADSPRFRTNIGSVQYHPEQAAIIWKIKQFGGGKEFLMRAELGLPSVKEAEPERKKRPISVKFEIPYFTTSGIQVRYLKIIEPKLQYPSLPWVRYISCAAGESLSAKLCWWDRRADKSGRLPCSVAGAYTDMMMIMEDLLHNNREVLLNLERIRGPLQRTITATAKFCHFFSLYMGAQRTPTSSSHTHVLEDRDGHAVKSLVHAIQSSGSNSCHWLWLRTCGPPVQVCAFRQFMRNHSTSQQFAFLHRLALDRHTDGDVGPVELAGGSTSCRKLLRRIYIKLQIQLGGKQRYTHN
jgi:hypothetical protein